MTARFLNIGDMAIAGGQDVLKTVLGSCVAVCVYAPSSGVGGMLHFALPHEETGMTSQDSMPYRYGDAGIPALVAAVAARAGVGSASLRAKIVGGASTFEGMPGKLSIGMQNVVLAKQQLLELGVSLGGEDVGGIRGRSVYFFPGTGRVRVAFVDGEAAAEACAPGPSGRRIRVLIVDDDGSFREALAETLASDPAFEVVGQAASGREGGELVGRLRPDVITLDVRMPQMDGLRFLREGLHGQRTPVVMISGIGLREGRTIMDCLAHGAVDFLEKPFDEQALLQRLKEAAVAKVRPALSVPVTTRSHRLSDAAVSSSVVVIGASTGGTVAITDVMTRLPATVPPILVAQHIPPVFSRSFAERLARLCPFPVREAVDGEEILPNQALIAPGGFHMTMRLARGRGFVVVSPEPAGRPHLPEIDQLFSSVAACCGAAAVGVLLTGMGRDGAAGLLAIRQAGGYTLTQDEASCVVYGMPKAAREIGAATLELALADIPDALLLLLEQRRRAG